MRKLVTVQKIDSIVPIPKADRIEAARILGWNIVVGKDEFKVGDKVAYFEVDSFLRGDNPIYKDFLPRGSKIFYIDEEPIEGHVLKTMKLRGCISQGLAMKLTTLGFTEEEISNFQLGDEITDKVQVVKYEDEVHLDKNIIGSFDTRFVPKTDAERIQNLSEYWEEIKSLEWEASVKVDGTSQTLLNDDGIIRLFGRDHELKTSTSIGFEVAEKVGIVEELLKNPKMAIQFELVGPGINKNRLKFEEKAPIIFSVWVNNVKIPRNDWPQVFKDNATPILGDEYKLTGNLDEMIQKVSNISNYVTKNVRNEGVVYSLKDVETNNIPLWLDRNLNIKIISNGYLLKHNL